MTKNKCLRHLLCILLVGSLLCLFACGRQPTPEAPPVGDNPADDLFADEKTNIPVGSISHGPDTKVFSYTGQKLELPYHVEGSGLGTTCGFLLFLDGIPQPYQIESNGACSYLHLLQLEDNISKEFSFYLEPVVGETGETLELYILSIIPQTFSQTEDMLLGTSQNFLESFISLTFAADAVPAQSVPDSNNFILKNLSVSEEELTPENIDRYLQTEITGDTASDLNAHVFQMGTLNNDNGIELEHILLGHPGVKYRTTLFLDYTPLWYDSLCYMDRDIQNGLASRLDASLDADDIREKHLLSVISVPRNASDFPDDVLTVQIWSALLEDTQ